MSNREEQTKFILKYAPHTIIGKIKGGITRERLDKLSNANLSTLYRKARNIVQKEIFEKGIKIKDRESWRDDFDLLKRATKDLNLVLKKGVGLKDPMRPDRYNRIKNSFDRTEEEDEILYNWSKKYSEKLDKLMKENRDKKIPSEVLRPLFKENGYNFSLIRDITRGHEVHQHQVEQNVSEKVGKKLEGKLGKDLTNKIAEFFDEGQEGYEPIEYDKHGKRRKYRAKLKYGEPRFEKTWEPDSDDEEMERRRIKKELKNVENNKEMTKSKKPKGQPPPPKYYNPYGFRDEERGEKPKKTQSLSAINLPIKMGDVKRSESMPVMSSRIEETLDRFRMAIQEDEEDDFAPDWVEEGEEEKTLVPEEGVVEVEEEPNSVMRLPPPMVREDTIPETIPMKTPVMPRSEIVKKARKQRKRDILNLALTDKGRIMFGNKYGNLKQTNWTNDMVKNFVLGLNNDEIEMAFKAEYKGKGDIKDLKEVLEINEAQRKVQPPLGRLVASKTQQINIGVEKKEKQLGVSGTTHINIDKEEGELSFSDIKQINIQPSFGVNKKVAQKTIGTDLNLGEYARATGLNQYEAAALVGQGGKSMVAPGIQREEEKKIDERVRAEVRAGGGDVLDILKEAAGNIGEGMFGDNMIREVNAGLTGLEINPSIPIRRGLGQPFVSDIVRSQLGVRGRIIEDESPLQQVEILEGAPGELPHAQAVVGNIDDEELVESKKLAGNNMYSEDQQLFLGRERANKIMERRKEPLDKELNNESERGRGEPHYEGKYDMPDVNIEPDQEGVDYGDVEPIEGRDNMNRINQQYLENRNIRGKGTWTGNRGIGYDFQRQAMVDRESNHLRNAQSLNYLRGQSIPYNMPTRNYATNQVGLIRNSNRSMILEVNALEP